MTTTTTGSATCRPDPRLAAYVLAAATSVVAAVALGRPALLVAAAPMVTLSALGVLDRRPPVVDVAVGLASSRVLDGEPVDGTVTLVSEGRSRHDVLLVPGRGLRPDRVAAGVASGWHLPDSGGRRHQAGFRLAPVGWGRHQVGAVHVRSRRPWGLLVWDVVARVEGEIRVLPLASRVSRLLDPDDPQGLAGPHRSRARGHGSDVAELRPYRPGDRLRDLNWSATARTGQAWVAEHHPERTGTVVLLVDRTGDGAGPGAPAFARVARVAWTLASAHLQVGDRVGILVPGTSVSWLAPVGGRRARLQVLEALLELTVPARRTLPVARPLLPADALVVGLTMLQSESFVTTLARHRRHGRSAVAVVVDPTVALPATTDAVEVAARRLWRGELQVRRGALARAGVPTAVVADGGDVAAAVGALRRSLARPALRRAR